MNEHTKHIWFKKWGWVHRPVHVGGWILVALFVFLVVHVFVAVDRHSHSGSDTLINVFPWAWIFYATLEWVAGKMSA